MIAAELTALQQSNGPYELIALTEVLAANAQTFKTAAEVAVRQPVDPATRLLI